MFSVNSFLPFWPRNIGSPMYTSQMNGTGRKSYFGMTLSGPLIKIGMIGTSISGVTFVSVPGWVRSTDMTYIQMAIGFFFGYMFIAHVLLPLYYKLNLTYGKLGVGTPTAK